MEEIRLRLNGVADTYDGFITAVLTYAGKKPSRHYKINEFMDNNPDALSADILEFISSQDDFYEDAAYVNRG